MTRKALEKQQIKTNTWTRCEISVIIKADQYFSSPDKGRLSYVLYYWRYPRQIPAVRLKGIPQQEIMNKKAILSEIERKTRWYNSKNPNMRAE